MTSFSAYAKAALERNITTLEGQPIEDNWLSKVGKLLEWPVSQLPREIWHSFHNPKVLTIALTIVALTLVQFVFYPVVTALAVKAAALWIAAHISYSAVHFGLYLTTMSFVLGNGLLAFGRFTNKEVLKKLEPQHS